MTQRESRAAKAIQHGDAEQRVRMLPLNEALLDREALDDLLSDIELATSVVEVRLKGGAAAHSIGATTLAEARDALLGGGAAAAQICYEYRGQRWIDTLMRVPSGVRLIRSPLPSPARV